MLFLKSSQFMPWPETAFSSSSMLVSLLSVRMASSRLMSSGSTFTHVLGTLDQEGLIDEVAESVFLAIFDVGLQLVRSAAVLAFGLGFFHGSLARLVVLRARNDFIVDAGDDLLDGLSGIGINGFRSGGLCGLF